MSIDDATGSLESIKPTISAVEFDAQRYLPELADLEISEGQKTELLGILWSIMRSFVDLGFDVKRCGQLLPILSENPEVEIHWKPVETEPNQSAVEAESLP